MSDVRVSNLHARPVTDVVGKSGKTYSFGPKRTRLKPVQDIPASEVESIQFQDLFRSSILKQSEIPQSTQNRPALITPETTALPKPPLPRRTKKKTSKRFRK